MEKETQLPPNQQLMTPDEVMITQMALTSTIEDLEETFKMGDGKMFKKDAMDDMAAMIRSAKSALVKIAGASGHLVKLNPYQGGDENEFMNEPIK